MVMRYECPTCRRRQFICDIPQRGDPNHDCIMEIVAIHKTRCSKEFGYVIPPESPYRAGWERITGYEAQKVNPKKRQCMELI